MRETEQDILNRNVDKSLATRNGTLRKARSVASYEFNWLKNGEHSYGASIYHSILKGFASVFEYEGLPEDIRANEFESFLIQSGRMKIIKVGKKFYPVHVVPKKYNHYGDWVETTIIEPYLPGLTGKTTEKFLNVTFKNDVLGQSLVKLIYPFLTMIDDTLFNMDTNQKALSGKAIWLSEEIGSSGDNQELEDQINQWYIDGKPVKVVEKTAAMGDNTPLIPLSVVDGTDSFISTIDKAFSQMLNVLGIPNNGAEGKKERMIVSEISIQNVLQSSILDDMLKMRQIAIEECNKVFGWNASVKVRDEIDGTKLMAGDTDPSNVEGGNDAQD